jgi:leucyl aminopeptidase
MKVSCSKQAIASESTEIAAFFVAKKEREKTLADLSKHIKVQLSGLNGDFKADESNVLTLYPPTDAFKPKRVALLGLGDKPTLDSFRKAAAALAAKVREMKLTKAAIDLSGAADLAKLINEGESDVAQAVTEGFLFGLYDFDELKTDRVKALKEGAKHKSEPKFEMKDLTLCTSAAALTKVETGAQTGMVIGEAQSLVRDLINSPSNYMTAVDLANAAKRSGKKYGYSVTVFDKKKLQDLKMGGLLGVNLGSHNPPTFSILEYKPKSYKKTIAIVGKGVTFDTGGISLKPAENMGDMKSDMSGAADVIGAVEAAARLKLPVHVVGLIPATDNKPSHTAQNPGDVLTTYSGITVEVDNTDAEGRLILADALTYAKEKFNPDVIIDLATLTGACVIALGYQAAGMFTQNDELAEKLSKAGFRSGEKVWRMPLWDDYDHQIKSNVADLKNTGGRGGGAVTAAKFLEKFVGDHKAWVHLDIAGPSFSTMASSGAKGSSGYGVRLLTEALRYHLN